VPDADAIRLAWWPAARAAELQAFLGREWRAGHVLARDEELLRWQHPRDAEELSFVGAIEADELVGVLGIIPIELCVRGARTPGAWLTTWIVVPAARRRRVGLRLLRFVLDRYDFVGTIGGNATTTTILQALRFHTRPAIPRWVRPLDEDALERLAGRHVAAAPAAADPGGGAVSDWSADLAAAWDRTWVERLAPHVVGTWRDAAYLEWRYLSHPRFDYAVRVALDDDGSPAALLVHRVEEVRGLDATVVRVVEAVGEEAALRRLADDLVSRGTELGFALADFYCTSTRYAAALEAAGFVAESTLAEQLPSRFQPLEPTPRPLSASLRLASWPGPGDLFAGDDVYFTRSDCDQDRPV
jgi:GNAT superfamily N-acetyltransferase